MRQNAPHWATTLRLVAQLRTNALHVIYSRINRRVVCLTLGNEPRFNCLIAFSSGIYSRGD
ncbi:hypothetical protein Bphyt_5609 [Paraburkholderia phytofirmans PsJN]|uniref:Uncharacterized protein n=1 Tax=Paraburkholderia phytofirmans (strain DSM 17436 / LMG 22146 / PsJN) TaxID=398527 RepID=B2TG85_PARPJ|nr:hypothetical protein Bphyt_5609 [Paraburkholderia phytofirmans PsJN]